MMSFRRGLRRPLNRFFGSERGAAAVEFALALFLLTIPVFNVIDLAFYAFGWMQTQNAAQMGAQAAFSDCNNTNDLPAATQCYGSNSANNMTLYDVVVQGVQESALNTAVALNGNVVDGYYCSTTGNVLTAVGTLGYSTVDGGTIGATAVGTAPTNGGSTCGGSYADSSAAPGEYIRVNVSHTYAPIFGFVSVASLLPATMNATAYVRID